MSKDWIRLLLFCLGLGTLFYFIHFRWTLTVIDLQSFILSFGWWSPSIFWLIYALGPLVFLPSSLLSVTAGLTYGMWPGVLYIWIGATGAAVTGYWLGYFFGDSIIKLHSFKYARIVQEKVKDRGFVYVLILRLIPLVGFNLLGCLSGMAKVRFNHYLTATMLGIIPGTLAYGLLGSSFLSGNKLFIFLAFIPITVLLGMSYVFRSRVKRWLGLDKQGN